MGRAQPLQGAVPRQGLLLPHAGGCGFTEGVARLAATAARGRAGDHWTRLVSLWHRAEPPDDRGAAAIHPRTRADRPPPEARRAVRAFDHARYPAQRRPAGVDLIAAPVAPAGADDDD